MGKEEDIKTRALQKIIVDLRMNHAEEIDKAYAYFWDENSPDEFLAGTALELGFINFEDWLVFDWKATGEEKTFLDLYLSNQSDLPDEERRVLSRIRDSVLSLYEVTSVSRDKRVLVKDILLSDEHSLRNRMLTRGLKKGDIFATRILDLDDGPAMSGCVYPYRREDRKKVLSYIDKQFGRYKRNVRADGTMRDFLKDYGDVFNIVWLTFIQNHAKDGQESGPA